ncbi:cob(I)yrinic acid a,c-diamide adenosyltransferase [Parvularcula sp. IMCC14364]|uniref:cob(I)yrinic acid a,c-diamide adenosyltransferase n=1 Tax=Parvularcula sp. IMCC14364 TaxID=3067902 RepID=UPI0027422799|nr:cob(I)yrinic acid a,c-diamide adenosyltransferase [Parvularcula sp. IMCC14364]
MVKLNKIYTRTGDAGDTGLVSGARVAKTSPRIEAIGSVDELNAAIGLALASLDDDALKKLLSHIQNDLFDMGADLATPDEMEGALRLDPAQATWLEEQMDALNDDLPPLTSFILPAGGQAPAALHLARAIARRAERDVWRLGENAPEGDMAHRTVTTYLNRLSDFLFIAARKTSLSLGREILWQPGKNRS